MLGREGDSLGGEVHTHFKFIIKKALRFAGPFFDNELCG
jgi:hypothetical protein